MEVCSSTSLLSRNSVLPIHWQPVSVRIKHKTTNSVKLFFREELDFGIRVVELHYACEVHLTERCREV